MADTPLARKAEQFLSLHRGPKILVLANVWDVASARIVERAGLKAVATSSAAIANSLGYPDGQKITRADMLAVVERIASKVSVPVSADLEAGYGDTPQAMVETARAMISAGAVGLNLEDGTGNPRVPSCLRSGTLRRCGRFARPESLSASTS